MTKISLNIMSLIALLCTPALFAMYDQTNAPFMQYYINNYFHEFMQGREMYQKERRPGDTSDPHLNLHLSCHYGRLDLVKELVQKDKDALNKKDSCGKTPLDVALISASAFEFPEDVQKEFNEIILLLAQETGDLKPLLKYDRLDLLKTLWETGKYPQAGDLVYSPTIRSAAVITGIVTVFVLVHLLCCKKNKKESTSQPPSHNKKHKAYQCSSCEEMYAHS